MADITQPSGLDMQDLERRRLGLVSLLLKMNTAQELIKAASASIEDVVKSPPQTGDASVSVYLKMEAAFAAIDETIRNLELAQSLCAKLGSSNIPRLPRFRMAISAGGQVEPIAPPQAE